MTSYVSHTSVDCRDSYALPEFRREVLGYVDVADDPDEPGDEECHILDPETGHWVTMADPEGNQFCVLRSDEERSAT